MAAASSTVSYWQEVTLEYADGEKLKVTLDASTIQKLEAGDHDLMERIRIQHRETEVVKPFSPTNPPDLEAANECQDPLPKHWTQKETKALFHLRREMEDQFMKAKTHKMLWSKISRDMIKQGYTVTQKQCENKFKSLKRDWRSCCDHNNTSGNDRKECSFFEEFNELYGMRAASCPKFVLASSDEPLPELQPELQPLRKAELKPLQTPRRRKATSSSSAPAWLNEYEERQVEFQEKRMKQMENMHMEKMTFLDKLLGVLDKKK